MPFTIPGSNLRHRTIGEMAEHGWIVRVRCECGHVAKWASKELPSLRQDMTLEQFAEKLKPCSRCGGSDGTIDYLNDTSARDAAERREFEADIASGKRKIYLPTIPERKTKT